MRLGTSEYFLERLRRTTNGEGSVKCFVYDLDYLALKQNWTLDSAETIESKMDDFITSTALADDSASSSMVLGKYKDMLGWNGATMQFVGISLEATNLTRDNRPPETVTRFNYEAYLDLADRMNVIASEHCGDVQMTGFLFKHE